MGTNQTITPYAGPPDGWDGAAQEANARLLKGALLKFIDGKWMTGKEGTPVPDGLQLAALGTQAAWVFWQNGKPVDAETIFRQPGGQLPDRDTLSHNNSAEWPKNSSDERQDPWRNTRLVYLCELPSAEMFTFSTTSMGGFRAVADLGDQVKRMRTVHPDATPIVELRAAPMPTKHGMKSRPVFKVVGWESTGGEAPTPAGPRLTQRQELDAETDGDEIPY
jgi:hypothetical protein